MKTTCIRSIVIILVITVGQLVATSVNSIVGGTGIALGTIATFAAVYNLSKPNQNNTQKTPSLASITKAVAIALFGPLCIASGTFFMLKNTYASSTTSQVPSMNDQAISMNQRVGQLAAPIDNQAISTNHQVAAPINPNQVTAQIASQVPPMNDINNQQGHHMESQDNTAVPNISLIPSHVNSPITHPTAGVKQSTYFSKICASIIPILAVVAGTGMAVWYYFNPDHINSLATTITTATASAAVKNLVTGAINALFKRSQAEDTVIRTNNTTVSENSHLTSFKNFISTKICSNGFIKRFI